MARYRATLQRLFLGFILFLGALQVDSVWAGDDLEPSYKGGELRVWLQAWPKSLNYYVSSDQYSAFLNSFVAVTLLETNQDNWTPLPYLAAEWELGSDKKTYTFTLNPRAKWSDGKPITAEDVKFTYDFLWNPKKCALCEPVRSFVGEIESVKILSPEKVQIKMKKVHFQNLERLGSVFILPEHKYGKGNFDKDFNKDMWGGGPYEYDKKGSKFRKNVVLRRIKNYWANEYPHIRERYNFDKIIFDYIKDATVAFESFKRKKLDLFYFDLPTFDYWDNQKTAPFTDKNCGVLTARLYNPSSWSGIALNMRKGVTSDVHFRRALQYLLNRDLMISKIFNNHFAPITGPFMRGGIYSYPTKPTPFDIEKARDELRKAGFKNVDRDGILYREREEGGKKIKERASLRVLYSLSDHSKWITVWKEDAIKAGVEIEPRLMEWSAAVKLLDDFDFEGFVISWSGDPVPAPNQLWYGKNADKKSSSNLSGLKNPEIDHLIELAPAEFNEKKRIKLFQEMEKLIIDEQPYVFRWSQKEHYVAYWKDKVNPTEKPYFKFGGTLMRGSFFTHWRAVK